MRVKAMLFVVLLLAGHAVYAEPGAVKIGAVVSVDNTHDVSLVEFLTFEGIADGREVAIASLNLGGSYKGESLGLACLLDAKGFFKVLEKYKYWPKFFTFSALDFECGVYVSRQFSDQQWEVGFCSTLISHKF